MCGVMMLLSIPMIAPHMLGPWAIAAGAFLMACAIGSRSIQAIHLSLLSLIWVVAPPLIPACRAWPLYLLVPLTVYGILVAVFPSLRQSLNWLRLGRLAPDILTLVLATIVVSGSALVIWYFAAQPDLGQFLRNMPRIATWLLPIAGLGFAMGNAAMEETIFRGVIMNALDSAFGTGIISVLLQAIPFGLLHKSGFPGGVWGMVLAFVYGVMQGAIRRRSQGMLAPWLAHVGADAVIFAIIVWFAPPGSL